MHILGVDNALQKVGDPVFLGYAIENQLQIASKYISKRHPEEKVGVHAESNGKPTIVEYSELSNEQK